MEKLHQDHGRIQKEQGDVPLPPWNFKFVEKSNDLTLFHMDNLKLFGLAPSSLKQTIWYCPPPNFPWPNIYAHDQDHFHFTDQIFGEHLLLHS